MIAKNETSRVGRKAKSRDVRTTTATSKPAPKKFQKLVIQTLLKKGTNKSDVSEPEDFEIPQFVGTNLDLTKKRLKEFPSELLRKSEFVQYLYLEGNKLTELPESFFQCLSYLKWLDLRNNDLIALPTSGLKNHAFLEFLLLQGNRIKHLPTELGVLPNLKGLQITGNPIVNVPYDVIADGFHSIVAHLRKANWQENILLPNSDAIVVRPCTVKEEENLENSNDTFKEPSEDLINEVDKVIQSKPSNAPDFDNAEEWKELDEESYAPFNSWNETKKLLLRSKMCPKPKQRIISSSYHQATKRRSRLGYKRRMVTPEMIQEKAKKEIQMAKRRETLEKQAQKIQRMKDKEVLKTWRRQSQRNAEHLRLLDNYQHYPSRNFVTDTPFDVDPEFLNMLNRTDLYRSLKEMEAIHSRKKKVPELHITISDLEKQMREVREKLESLNISDCVGASPRTKQTHLCNKIAQMKEIQKTLQSLQHRNGCVTGNAATTVNNRP